MKTLLQLIQSRHSTRAPFDPKKPVSKADLHQILEAARWAPTPHNMQNFEIVVINDREMLEEIGKLRTKTSVEFIRENYQQLSFSQAELQKKKVGILGMTFPASWTDPQADFEKVVRESQPSFLRDTMKGCSTILLILYDTRKRAPASKGDVLGILGLGAVMENIWLMAASLGISLQIMSVFGGNNISSGNVEQEIKRLLKIPESMKISYAIRLGYPVSASVKYPRVRRNVADFTHENKY